MRENVARTLHLPLTAACAEMDGPGLCRAALAWIAHTHTHTTEINVLHLSTCIQPACGEKTHTATTRCINRTRPDDKDTGRRLAWSNLSGLKSAPPPVSDETKRKLCVLIFTQTKGNLTENIQACCTRWATVCVLESDFIKPYLINE